MLAFLVLSDFDFALIACDSGELLVGAGLCLRVLLA